MRRSIYSQLLLQAVLSGCAQPATEPTDSIAGSYALVTIQGHPLPAPAAAYDTVYQATLTLPAAPSSQGLYAQQSRRNPAAGAVTWSWYQDGIMAVVANAYGPGTASLTLVLSWDRSAHTLTAPAIGWQFRRQ